MFVLLFRTGCVLLTESKAPPLHPLAPPVPPHRLAHFALLPCPHCLLFIPSSSQTQQDVLKQANATFVATVKDIVGNIPLPPGVKLPELKLPPLNVSSVVVGCMCCVSMFAVCVV